MASRDYVKGSVSFGMPLDEIPKWTDLNRKVVHIYAVYWRYIGIELGLAPVLMNTIAENCAAKPQRIQECLIAVLEKWLMQDGPNATWCKLEHAITNAQRVQLGLSPLEMRESSVTTIEQEAMVNFKDCKNPDECFSHFTAAMYKILSKVEFHLLCRACIENPGRLGGVELPKDLKESIRASHSLSNLFDVLCDTPYWNWMNIKMLGKMARASHLDAASKLIQQYRDEVFSRKVMEVLQQIPNPKISDKYYTKVKEKWNKNLDELTVNDVVNHWSEVEQIFNVEEPTILLDHLDGSVEIYWLVPTELIGGICRFIEARISMLHKHDILYFDTGGHLIKRPATVEARTIRSAFGRAITGFAAAIAGAFASIGISSRLAMTREQESMINFKDCENPDECFSHFTAAMYRILSKVEFPLLRRACIENAGRPGGVTLPKDLEESIWDSDSLSNLFDVLCKTPYWNWMNIKMLGKMARASHLDAASKLIQQYRDEVFSRKVMEVLQQIPSPRISDNYYTKVKEKWNKNLDDLTVNDVVNHWSEVEQIFNVEEPTILLDHLLDGSVEIYWLVPTELIGGICRFIEARISMLHKYDILYFDIGGHLIKRPATGEPHTSAVSGAIAGPIAGVGIISDLAMASSVASKHSQIIDTSTEEEAIASKLVKDRRTVYSPIIYTSTEKEVTAKPKGKKTALSISLLIVFDHRTALCDRIQRDLLHHGYHCHSIFFLDLFPHPAEFKYDAVILDMHNEQNMQNRFFIRELPAVLRGSTKLFSINPFIRPFRLFYEMRFFYHEHAEVIPFSNDHAQYKNSFDQLISKIQASFNE